MQEDCGDQVQEEGASRPEPKFRTSKNDLQVGKAGIMVTITPEEVSTLTWVPMATRDAVRIDNSFTLETWAQGWDSNPDPESLQAAGPMD
ncbi:hypothetical protein DSO57_1026970 [Entomophthora muscae]|uniref:Uncharacterized protein n=1 Tax=Entomophthora muscae TaxID=34485 RepID=A0ACC2UBQ7_9FUNG|nr:hypothetical protein DSO57_1026970 [Entomophthora muscae]